MSALTILAYTSASLVTGLYLLRRLVSLNWLTFSAITHPTVLTENHVIVITGGNCGLGYETALDLARRGATLVLACRDVIAGEKAANTIRASTKNDNITCMELDLSCLTSVRKFAKEVTLMHENIYALVCNAGVWMPMERQTKTRDGYELHFAVNHLGHFALIQELLPNLKNSEMESRVVLVSSSLSKLGKIDMDTKEFLVKGREQSKKLSESFAPSGYCDSKLMNILTCRRLASELEESNVTTYSVCPGFCHSQLERHVDMPLIARLFQRSSVRGAQNIVFTTVQDKSCLINGGFYQEGKVNQEMMTSHQDIERPLWDLSMKLVSK